MNALEFNNQIANLITRFITNIPTIGQFDPENERPNRISWITFNNNKHWDSIKNISTFKNGGHPNIS